MWRDLIELRQVLARELHGVGADIFLEIFSLLGAGNRHDLFALNYYPCQRELRRGASFLGRHFLDAIDQRKILPEVLALKTRREAPVVVVGKR